MEDRKRDSNKEKLRSMALILNRPMPLSLGPVPVFLRQQALLTTDPVLPTIFPSSSSGMGMTDMYSAGFYPFKTPEEKWAYWSRHIYVNRYDMEAGRAYKDLFQLVNDRNYFVITTNVDHQFQLAGFDDDRIFATQGDYGLFQCKRACHKRLYENENQVREMVKHQKNCRIPSSLVPEMSGMRR